MVYGEAGKGDTPRPVDKLSFDDNYNKIDWGKGKLITLVNNCDVNFLKFTRPLVKSFLKFNPEGKIRLYLTNCEPQKDLEDICEKVEYDIHRNLSTIPDYTANRRVYLVRDLLQAGVDNILWLDSDSIVRKDVSKLFNEDFDVTAFPTPSLKHDPYLISTFAVKNTPRTKAFVKYWAALVEDKQRQDNYQHSIMTVQYEFTKALGKMRESIKFMPLPETYVDYHFGDEKIIWCAKGPHKYKNERYILETKKYADQA